MSEDAYSMPPRRTQGPMGSDSICRVGFGETFLLPAAAASQLRLCWGMTHGVCQISLKGADGTLERVGGSSCNSWRIKEAENCLSTCGVTSSNLTCKETLPSTWLHTVPQEGIALWLSWTWLFCSQELNLPCIIFAEHLCKCNWAFQTCNGCEFFRAVDAEKIEARRIAVTLCEQAMESADFNIVW